MQSTCSALFAILSIQTLPAAVLLGGTDNGALFGINTDEGNPETTNSANLLPFGISGLAYDASGVLWGSDRNGNVFTFDSSGSSFLVRTPAPIIGGVTAIAFDPTGSLWVGNNSGQLAAYDTTTWRITTTIAVPTEITALDFDATQTLWAGSPFGDLMTINLALKKVNLETSLAAPLEALTFDQDGILWAGNGDLGNLFSINPTTETTNVINSSNPVSGGIYALAIPEPSNFLLIGVITFSPFIGRRRTPSRSYSRAL